MNSTLVIRKFWQLCIFFIARASENLQVRRYSASGWKPHFRAIHKRQNNSAKDMFFSFHCTTVQSCIWLKLRVFTGKTIFDWKYFQRLLWIGTCKYLILFYLRSYVPLPVLLQFSFNLKWVNIIKKIDPLIYHLD